MFDRFTSQARQVMVLSRMEANRLGHDFIGTGHILVGLAQEGTGIAARVLKNLDLDADSLQEGLERHEETGGAPMAGIQVPFTPRVKRVLENTLQESLTLGHDSIGTEHLLLGLVRESEGPAARVLQALGAHVDEIRELVHQMIGGNPPGDEQEEARALVEAILLKRLHNSPIVMGIPGSVELEVRSSYGQKGWGFQLWLGHVATEEELRTEMAFWAASALTLEEHFAGILELFVGLVRSDTRPPAA